MKKFKRALALFLALVMLAAVLVGCSQPKNTPSTEDSASTADPASPAENTQDTQTPTRTLKIRAVIDPMYAPTWKDDPIEDSTLVDLVNQKIMEHTGGVAVEVEWIVPSSDQVRDSYLNMLIAADDVPDVLVMNDLPNSKDTMGLIDAQGIVRELDADLIKANMPAYTARIEEYGGDLDAILAGNQFEGKNLYLPCGFSPDEFPTLADKDLVVNGIYYGLYLRDDILTQIFPEARTEAEMRELMVEKGELTPEDICGDIPINSMEDLYDYLQKVKELNLTVGEKQVIPGCIFRSSEMADSTLWSLASATGNAWQAPLFFNNDLEKSEFPYACEDFREYCRWLNKYYNDGLLDPELFVMKDDQLNGKVTNGEYAVINGTVPTLMEAKEVGAERGYGYRYLPAFYPLDFTKKNNNMTFTSLKASGPVITTSVSDEDLEVVMKWLDFYMSEEYDEIAAWGHPDWYEGEGADRRYKDEYKAIENWALYGETSEKDGFYYHMPVTEALGNYSAKSDPVMRPDFLQFFGGVMNTYPEGPYYVLEKDPAKMEAVDVGTYSASVMNKDAMSHITTYIQDGWDITTIYTEKWQAFENNFWYDPTWIPMIAQAVIAPEGQFDAAWAAYETVLDNAGRREAEADAAAVLKDMIENHTTPVK